MKEKNSTWINTLYTLISLGQRDLISTTTKILNAKTLTFLFIITALSTAPTLGDFALLDLDATNSLGFLVGLTNLIRNRVVFCSKYRVYKCILLERSEWVLRV